MNNDICKNKHKGASTSIEAFESIKSNLSQLQSLVYNVVASSSWLGSTVEEASNTLNIPVHSLSGRFSELKRINKIRHNGTYRLTRSGNRAKVYVVTKPQLELF